MLVDGEWQRTYFLYDGNNFVGELNETGQVVAWNTFGPYGLIGRTVPSYAEGVPDAETFYQFDALGNVVSRLNLAGEVVSNDAYDAWGTLLARSGSANDPFGYKGEYGYYTDPETGLILCTLRYYDPATGRWLTRDPIGIAGGINLYGYCDNNPVGGVDPLGLSSMDSSGDSGGDWFDKLSNGAAGAGDIVSGGLTKKFRQWAGYDDVVNYDSTAYKVGEGVGWGIGIVETVVGIGAAANAIKGWQAVRAAENLASAGEKLIVLGENMPKRVIPVARALGAEIYKGWPGMARAVHVPDALKDLGYLAHNEVWLREMIQQGYKIVDIGIDVTRKGSRSPFYAMERRVIEELGVEVIKLIGF